MPHATNGNPNVKLAFASVVADTLSDRELTQTEAAYIMRDAPSQISLVVTNKLRGFSTERLTRMVARLGHDVEIRISKAKTKTGKISVRRIGV